METKICKYCDHTKEINEFRDGRGRCKSCRKEWGVNYRLRKKSEETEEEKQLRILNHREYYRKRMTDPKIKAIKKEQSNRGRDKHPERLLYHRAKQRARKNNLEFTITMQDIVVPEICPVFKIPMKPGGDAYNSPSLDRIDSSKGYTKDNIMVICYRANTLKNDSTPDELRMLYEFYCNPT